MESEFPRRALDADLWIRPKSGADGVQSQVPIVRHRSDAIGLFYGESDRPVTEAGLPAQVKNADLASKPRSQELLHLIHKFEAGNEGKRILFHGRKD